MGRQVFVGRTRELEWLREALASLETRRGGHLLLTGPPGIGKRALLDQALVTLPATFLRARAHARSPEPLPDQWLQALLHQIGSGTGALLQRLALDDRQSLEAWLHQGASLPFATFEAVLRALAGRAPVVLTVEGDLSEEKARDLHRLAERTRGLFLLWIVATPLVPGPLRLWPHQHLSPLTLQDLHRWLLAETGVYQTPQFLAWLWLLSGGIPAEVRALLDLLAEQGQPLEPGRVLTAESVELGPLLQRERARWQSLPLPHQNLLFQISCSTSVSSDRFHQLAEHLPDADLLLRRGFLLEERGRIRLRSGLLRQSLQKYRPPETCTPAPEEKDASPPTPHDLRHLYAQFLSFLKEGRLQEAHQWIQKANLPALQQQYLEAELLSRQGNLPEALQRFLAIYRDTPEGTWLRARASASVALISYGMGNLVQSLHFLEESQFHARAAHDQETLVFTQEVQCLLQGLQGQLHAAEAAWWNTLQQTSREFQFLPIPLYFTGLLFFVGRYPALLHALQQGHPTSPEDRVLNLVNQAEVYLEMGQTERARVLLEEAWPLLLKFPLWMPVGERLRAQVLLQGGHLDQAAQWAERCLAHYAEMHAPMGLLKALALRAEVRIRRGDLQGAQDLTQALGQAKQRRYLVMIPYLLERGLRGLAHLKRPPTNLRKAWIEQYVQAVDTYHARERVPWFLKSLPPGPVQRTLAQRFPSSGTGRRKLYLYTLGTFRVVLPTLEERVHLGSVKAKHLLATLALAPVVHLTPTSQFLARALWPGLPGNRQIHNLHWAFSLLRKLLGSDVLHRQNDQYLLNPDRVEVDLWQFHRLYQAGRTEEGRGAHARAAGLYEQALQLVTGPPLQDARFPALEPHIAHLQRQILRLYAYVARFYARSFRPEQARLLAGRGLTLNPEDPDLLAFIS